MATQVPSSSSDAIWQSLLSNDFRNTSHKTSASADPYGFFPPVSSASTSPVVGDTSGSDHHSGLSSIAATGMGLGFGIAFVCLVLVLHHVQ
jgi:hypothetical protein